MLHIEHRVRTAGHPDAAIPVDTEATLFVVLELSLSSWVIAASAPGEDKASKHGVAACDGPALLALLDRLRQRAEARRHRPITVAVIQEAGRDGFWAELAKKVPSAKPMEGQRRGIAFWKRMGCGASWSIRPRLR